MKKLLFITATLFLFFLVCGSLFVIILPWAVTSNSSRLLHKYNINEGKIRLDTLSPTRTVISGFLGKQDHPALSLPRVEIHYSPKQIMQAEIESIQVEGAVINFDLDNGKLSLRGFKPPQDNQEKTTTGPLPTLPLSIREVRFLNCRAIIHTPDDSAVTTSFTAKIDIETSEKTNGSYQLQNVSIELETNNPFPALLSARLEKIESQMRLNLSADVPNLSPLHKLAPQWIPPLSGRVELKTDVDLPDTLTGFSQLSASLALRELNIQKKGFSLVSKKDRPLLLSVNGNDKQLEYSISGLDIASKQSVSAKLHGTIKPRLGALDGKGTIDSDFLTEPLQLTIDGKNETGNSSLNIVLESKEQQIDLSTTTVHTSPFSVTTRIINLPQGITATGTIRLDRLQTNQPKLDIKAIAASFSHSPDTENQRGVTSGQISIPFIRYRGEDLAETTAKFSIPNTTGRLQLAGSVTGHQAKPARIFFSGSYDPVNELALTFGLKNTQIDNHSLPALTPLPNGLDISTEISASGNFSLKNGIPKGFLNLKLQNGTIQQEEKNISIKGIATELTFDDLPQIRSRGSQLLTLDSIDISTIHINNGSISYQLENGGSLFIERSRFNWCGGKVEIGSTRINPSSKAFATTLYCDRLQFAELLTQLGISDTEGDGSLNGRLPVEYSKDGFIFDDGFLFSTPGNSGIVRFNNTDMLQQSLPDTSQAAYLDYSIQALENFSYNWTKLTFKSIGEDLLIGMQIDGKPARPLPYGYKQGHLVKKPDGSGIQRPLRLDINFHLPFGEMFKYGQSLQKIMENM